ncbi:MAG: flagellar biosynthesis protein FliQ [Bacillota bacterium]
MTPDGLLNIVQQAIMVILIMIAPIIGSGLAVGLTVSILQATTQIQEPTLAFVPKIVAVLLAVMIFGGWVFSHVVQFTLQLWRDGLTML